MELRQLKFFVRTAQTLNFSRAARELYVTQSTLSQGLKKLEEELEAQLFYRDSHNVSLTEAGETLLPFAMKAIEDSENCLNCLDELACLHKGKLNIGVTHSFRAVSTEALLQFVREWPQIEFDICYKNCEELMEMLISRQLDIVLAYSPSELSPLVESHNLFEDRLCAIVSNSHPLVGRQSVSLEELQRHQLTLPAPGMQSRRVLDHVCETQHISLNPSITLNLVNPILELVAHGKMVTILPRKSLLEKSGLVAIPIDAEGTEMEGAFHILKDSYAKQASRNFVRLLCETNLLRLKMENLFNSSFASY